MHAGTGGCGHDSRAKVVMQLRVTSAVVGHEVGLHAVCTDTGLLGGGAQAWQLR